MVFGPSRRWRVERPQNSVHDRRPFGGFRPLAALARGASSKFCSRSTTLLWFSAPCGAGAFCRRSTTLWWGAWSVLRILFAIDDPLVVFGPSRRCRVECPQNSVHDRRPFGSFRPVAALARGASSKFCSRSTTFLWFLAPRGAGAWSVLRVLLAIDDPLVVFGPSRRWRVERPQNSVGDRRPSRGCRPLAALALGASSEFCSRSTTHSWFSAPCGAGAWSVFRILLAIDDPLVVFSPSRRRRVKRPQNSARDRRLSRCFGPSRRCRVERPQNSARDRRPSRGFLPLAALSSGASSEFCSRSTTLSWMSAPRGAGAWSVLRILLAIRCRVERPQNSVRDRRPSRVFRPLAALARGASSEFCWRSTTLSWFSAPRGAGAWSVLRILFAIDNPLVVFGPSRRWRVERPSNLRSPAGISFNRSTSLVLESTFP